MFGRFLVLFVLYFFVISVQADSKKISESKGKEIAQDSSMLVVSDTTKLAGSKVKKANKDSLKPVKQDTTKLPESKGKETIQDSTKAVTPDTKKLPSQKRWIKTVLGVVGNERKIDPAKTASNDTLKSPYDIIKSQNKTVIPLLIIRPVYGSGVTTLKNKWLLLLCETYMHFRLGGISEIGIVPPVKLSDLLPNYNEYNSAISPEKYKKAAKDLSVPYILYLQCQYSIIGKKVNFLGNITSVDNEISLARISKSFSLKELGVVFDQFAKEIVSSMGIDPDQRTEDFLKTPLMSKNALNLKKLGDFLTTVRTLDDTEWDDFLKKYKTLLEKDPQMLIGVFAAIDFCNSAEKHKEAASFSQALIKKLGFKYPPAYLMAIKYLSLTGDYNAAQKVIENARPIVVFQDPLKKEKAISSQKAPEAEKAPKSKKAPETQRNPKAPETPEVQKTKKAKKQKE